MPLYELFCGLSTSLIISPIMTLIDTSIIRTQIKNLKFRDSLIETSKDYLNRKICFRRPFNIMFLVYSSTYSTANFVEFFCKKNNIDYQFPVLFSTSIVNIFTIIYKDKEYTKIFHNKYNIFSKSSYGLFAIRDMLTILFTFTFKKNLITYLHDKNNIPYNTSDLMSSISLPIMAQTLSTPIHILAIDLHQRPKENIYNRFKNIKNLYIDVCIGRILRVIPAFCIGGFINDMLRNRL